MDSAVIYTRSARPNKRHIIEQEEACHAWARAKGAKVMETFSDDGYSGARSDRPGLRKALVYVHEHGIKYLLAASPDRVARGASLLLELDARISAAGAKMVFANLSSTAGIHQTVELSMYSQCKLRGRPKRV